MATGFRRGPPRPQSKGATRIPQTTMRSTIMKMMTLFFRENQIRPSSQDFGFSEGVVISEKNYLTGLTGSTG
jgi:hypothetical protein